MQQNKCQNKYHSQIMDLRRSYQNMSWFERLFFPYQLAVELNKYSDGPDHDSLQLSIFKAFEKSTWFFHKSTWFFHKWFFTSLRQFSNHDTTCSLRTLDTVGLLTGGAAQANFDAVVASQDSNGVASALVALHTAGLLTGEAAQTNFDAVVANPAPIFLAPALSLLHAVGLLTGKTAQAVVAHQNPVYLDKALSRLHTAGLLTGEAAQANFDAVVAHQKPRDAAFALSNLYVEDLLTGEAAQANFEAVVASQKPSDVASALSRLHTAGLLTGETAQANRDAVVASQSPRGVADALNTLHNAGLLTGEAAQANRDAVVANQKPLDVAYALSRLHTAGLLTGEAAQANFDAVVAHQKPHDVASALRRLHTAGLLTGEAAQANFDAVVAHQNPWGVADALNTLHNAGLLTGEAAQANREAVVAHQKPWGVASALSNLHAAGLLTGDAAQANFEAVVASQKPSDVAFALNTLHTAGLLTGGTAQANFDTVFITHSAILLHRDNHRNGVNLWDMMPDGRPTAAQFQAMIQIAQTHAANPDEGSRALMQYAIPYILHQQQNQRQPVLNDTQSTHTASVHASVSQSATKLFNRYGSGIQGGALDTNIEAFVSWVNAHTPKDFKQQAAARCISRLLGSNSLYIDKVSQVSTKQFMALAWIAIHDNSVRMGTLADAQQLLIEALHEIQRGYNLSDKGDDKHHATEDRPICTAGTFNKLCEKLQGVHPDAVIVNITPAGAALKLPIVAVEEAQKYLHTLTPDSQDYLKLQEQIKEDEFQPLWETISSDVASRLFNEFGSLYPEGINSNKFIEFLNQGLCAIEGSKKLTLPAAQVAVTPNRHALFQAHKNSSNAQQFMNTTNVTI